MIRFFNTLSGRIEPFESLIQGEVKLYTCGPTVYDYPHIGNYRAYMFEDLLKRFLKYMGFKVTHVMNITDVDDKTIKGAEEQGISLQEYTKDFTEAFFNDIEILNIDRAEFYPRATEHVQEMAQMVKGLLEKGYAYEKDGSYYFSISKFKNYGQLSKIDLSGRKVGVRIDSDEYEKESVHDFALWKARKEGEPAWDTVLGLGRPGWHIECSVMSAKYLGETFDIHCGGVDNIFPHHENEIAQSEAYTGKKFVNTWLHCQHLIRNGKKMSKSMGNTVTLRDLINGRKADPMAIRLLLLSTHYRKILNFTNDALDQAHASLQRIKDFVYELENTQFPEGEKQSVVELIDDMKKNFSKGLSDDLNMSVSLTAVFEAIKKGHVLISQGNIHKDDAKNLLSALQSVDEVLGILSDRYEGDLPLEIAQKIQAREKARLEKNFAMADKIRQELVEEGILLEDTKDGTRWKSIQRK
ncbi:MAG TPA: cysteine--tRNA ligase [Candidatus Heimdallarchaeota archaeon]|nr:cysteine--tRNA ligase [Candidatus Heimdallarchaeota archaeon]